MKQVTNTTASNDNTTATATAPSLPTNDNSNPQQGSGTQQNGVPGAANNTPQKTLQPDQQQLVGEAQKEANMPLNSASNNNNNINIDNIKKVVDPTRLDVRKLFVGGLPTDITEPEFRTFFSQFGELHDSVVMFDRETHRSRGFGFVTFQDEEISKKLLKMGGGKDGIGRLVMRGKTCEIKAAEPKEGGRRPPPKPRPTNNINAGPKDPYPMPAYHHMPYPHPDSYENAPPPFQGWHPYVAHGYMSPMYYPPHHPNHFYPAMGPGPQHFMEYPPGAIPGYYPEPPYVESHHSGPPVSGPPAPPPQQHMPYGFVPLMAVPAPQVVPATPPSAMHPVAPGIPSSPTNESDVPEE